MIETKNFKQSEFMCRCGCIFPKELESNLLNLMRELQKLRNHFNNPIVITSGYRCPLHNNKVGGVLNSTHTRAIAADFYVVGLRIDEVAGKVIDLAELAIIKPGGVGVYRNFIHYDIRGKLTVWRG